MLNPRPRTPSADPAPCWSPQPPAPSPAKRRRLHQEPARPEPMAQLELEAPAWPDSSALTSVVFLAAGCALQLPLDGVDLLLEPEPTSVLQVSFQGHTIFLVPEGLQDSSHFGQPGFSSPQGATLQDMPQDHILLGLQQETFSEYFHQEDDCGKDADLDFLASWVRPLDGEAAENLSSITGVPSPWAQDLDPESSTGAERYSPRFIWELDSYLVGPSPDSPLQPLPPSPSPSPQQQLPPRPPCSPLTPCKARRRLFCDELHCINP